MLFESLYRWFAELFGGDMADYLSGYECPSDSFDGGYTASNQFVMYGFIALGVALAVMFIYYYVIDHPRFNKLWSWLLMLLFVGISNMLIGSIMTIGDLNAGNIGSCLIDGSNGGVSVFNCWMFGLSNFIVSVLFFVIWSIAFKWKSKSCKRTPF